MDESLLMGLGGSGDPQAQQKALQYFEQLKAAENGWKLCANYIAQGSSRSDEYARFFCFQVIEDFLKNRYVAASPEDQQLMKNLLLSWIQIQACGPQDKTYLRNKGAQLFTLAFVVDFPQRWPTFFSDILQVLSLGAEGTDVYQRILMAVDSEVVDREISHSPQDTERNNKLKDDMRIHAIPQLVDSWYQIITTYDQSHPDLVCRTLEVIGAYIAWIDIGLIANDRFVSMLLKFMSNVLLRESACDCICEIIIKGMEPAAKLELIKSFMSVLQSTGVFNVTEDEEGDYLAKLSKLVNAIGLQLIAAWHKLVKSQNSDKAQEVFQELDAKVPLMFTFLSNEDDDVSGAIAKFAHDYITLVKQLNPLPSQQQQHLRSLLIIIIQKMKYDSSYNFDLEGEEEAMFQDYRKELKIIFNNLGAVDGNFLLHTVHDLLTKSLSNWQSQSYQDVEVVLYLLHSLAEAIPGIHTQSFQAENRKVVPLLEMMKLLVSSRVSCFGHPAVVLQFFETVVRYDKFFSQETASIPDVLTAFLDERGLRSKNAHVRSRAAYLFSRFVKSINKVQLQPYLDGILTQVDGLLVLNTPDNGVLHSLSSNDQLFLYETAGILIVQSSVPPEKKLEYMKRLLAPIVSKFEDLLKAMVQTTNEQQQLAYAQCISQAMAFASRTSKGFSSQMTMKNNGCVEVYTNILSIFLAALNVPVHRQLLHSAVRQFFHRMIVTLDTEVLPFIPVTMEHLLKNADAKELHDFIPLINQVMAKFKDHVVPFLHQVFMPIVQNIFQVLSTPADEQDQVAVTEIRMLRRSYFSFIAALLNNNVAQVLSNQESQNLHQVLLTVIQGGVEIVDPQAQKACFAILKKLVELWCGKDGLSGFDEFVYKSILPACFMAPMKPTFDLTDAQTVLVLNECAGCLKAIHEKKGDELIHYLQTTYLPSLNVSPELSQQFCITLKSDTKTFRNYFKSFFVQGKS